VPTWNYLVVHCTVEARLIEEPAAKDALLKKLIGEHEPGYAQQWRDLGEEFPDQKIREIFEEVLEDTKEQGALDLIRSQMAAFNMAATGMTPDGQPLMGQDAEGNPVPAQPPVDPNLAAQVQQLAYGIMPPEVLDFGSEETQ
jgi:transcriptional regulator